MGGSQAHSPFSLIPPNPALDWGIAQVSVIDTQTIQVIMGTAQDYSGFDPSFIEVPFNTSTGIAIIPVSADHFWVTMSNVGVVPGTAWQMNALWPGQIGDTAGILV